MTPPALNALATRLACLVREPPEPMGHRARRHGAQGYVQRLVLDGDPKSMEPMASRLPGADAQARRQFVGQRPWAVDGVPRRLAVKGVELLSAPDVWIIDDTACPKASMHSVRVARQDGGTLGQVANGQVVVSLHGRGTEASCPLHWRLYGPAAWIDDQQRAMPI
jgi:SRSO17 transposase